MTYILWYGFNGYDPPTSRSRTPTAWGGPRDTHSTAHAGATMCIFFIGKLSWGLTNNARLAA